MRLLTRGEEKAKSLVAQRDEAIDNAAEDFMTADIYASNGDVPSAGAATADASAHVTEAQAAQAALIDLRDEMIVRRNELIAILPSAAGV